MSLEKYANNTSLKTLIRWPYLGILILLSLLAVFHTPLVLASSCPAQSGGDIGDNACGCQCSTTNADAGSTGTGLLPNVQAGNPISLISGNKYQQEIDYRSAGSELQLRRHYNSINADINVGWGQGWSMSYSTYILRAMDHGEQIGFEVVQSDGRRIQFNEAHTDNDGRLFYRSPSASDGYVIQIGDDSTYWHLPDGKVISFKGSYIVRIDYPGAGFLTMYYRGGRLVEVKDQSERVIKFEYTAGRVGLKNYETHNFNEQEGHIRKVTLPDGKELHYDFDSELNLTRVRYADGLDRQYHYDSVDWTNNLTGITDQNKIRFASWQYDNEGRAIRSEHADGVELVDLRYILPDAKSGTNIGVTEVTNSQGAVSLYTWQQDEHQGLVRLLSATGPGCATCPPTGIQYEYDSSKQLTRITRDSGEIVDYQYDDQGRIISFSHSAKGTAPNEAARWTRYEYKGTSTQPSLISRPSVNIDGEHQVEITYNQEGLPTNYTEHGFAPLYLAGAKSEPIAFEPISRTTRLKYKNGLISELDGPRTDVADITLFHYDELQRLSSVNLPSGQTYYLSQYDSNGRPTVLRKGEQSPTTLTYDGNGLITQIQKRGIITTYRYDPLGNLMSVTNPDGKETTFEYDTAGRLTAITDDIGRKSTLTLDTENRIQDQLIYGLNGNLVRSLSYVFDTEGRLLKSLEQRTNDVNSNESVSQLDYHFDETNRLSSISNVDTGATIDATYNPFGQLAKLARSDGATTHIHYNHKGNRIGETDARNNLTITGKDDFGRTVMVDSPDTGITYYQYDSANNLIEKTDGDGDIFQYSWDAANRLTEQNSADDNISIEYDIQSGNVSMARNSISIDRFEYDQNAQLVSQTRKIGDSEFTTEYSYTDTGKLEYKKLPDGIRLRYHYHQSGENKGQIRAITRQTYFGLKQRTLLSEIDNDPRDGRSGYVSHNGLRKDMQFANDSTIKSIEFGDSLSLEYEFDNNGNIVGIYENDQQQRYQYIGGHLSSADTLSGIYQYDYDIMGNRVSKTEITPEGQQTNIRYQYSPEGNGNRLLNTVNGTSAISDEYEYTLSGAPTSAGRSLRYEYNAEQRPIAAYKNDILLARYAYNSFGQRIKKVTYNKSGTKTTYYLYEGHQLTAQISSSNANTPHVFKHTLFIDQTPAHFIDNGKHYAIHGDHNGTPRMLTDDDQKIVWQAKYSPFGKAKIVLSEIQFDHRFPGQIEDSETGTHYNYFRDYDAATGRYLTSDPIGLKGGPNSYLYASANPLSFTDILGLSPGSMLPISNDAWNDNLGGIALAPLVTPDIIGNGVSALPPTPGSGPYDYVPYVQMVNGQPQVVYYGAYDPFTGNTDWIITPTQLDYFDTQADDAYSLAQISTPNSEYEIHSARTVYRALNGNYAGAFSSLCSAWASAVGDEGWWMQMIGGMAGGVALRSSTAFVSGATRLTYNAAARTWTTPGGLIYGMGSAHGNRIKHVLDHLRPNPNKPTHSVFTTTRDRLLGLIDEAWSLRSGSGTLQSNGNRVFTVPMGRVVGTRGETNIVIVIKDGTNEVITSYPKL